VYELETLNTTNSIAFCMLSYMPENHRPTSVAVLSLFILGLSLWNGLRLGQSLLSWSILKEYQAQPGPLYDAISGGAWFIIGLLITWGLWRGRVWAWYGAPSGAVIYGSWYWIDRLIFQETHSNWPFALVSTIIFISFFCLLFRRRVFNFFH
jgi:hypothetical protein